MLKNHNDGGTGTKVYDPSDKKYKMSQTISPNMDQRFISGKTPILISQKQTLYSDQ